MVGGEVAAPLETAPPPAGEDATQPGDITTHDVPSRGDEVLTLQSQCHGGRPRLCIIDRPILRAVHTLEIGVVSVPI